MEQIFQIGHRSEVVRFKHVDKCKYIRWLAKVISVKNNKITMDHGLGKLRMWLCITRFVSTKCNCYSNGDAGMVGKYQHNEIATLYQISLVHQNDRTFLLCNLNQYYPP